MWFPGWHSNLLLAITFSGTLTGFLHNLVLLPSYVLRIYLNPIILTAKNYEEKNISPEICSNNCCLTYIFILSNNNLLVSSVSRRMLIMMWLLASQNQSNGVWLDKHENIFSLKIDWISEDPALSESTWSPKIGAGWLGSALSSAARLAQLLFSLLVSLF